jgi:hypothetical protein
MMGSFAALAGLELRSALRRHLRMAILVVFALILGVGAAAHALSALSLVLAARHGAVNANLMIGAGLLLCALVMALAAWWVRRRSGARQTKIAMTLAAAPLAASVGRSLAPGLLRTVPLILMAGLIAGRVLSTRE